MTKNEALKHFHSTVVDAIRTEKLKQLEEYYEKNKDMLFYNFIDNFKELCLKVKYMQFKGEKDSLGYINYSMLRTNIMDNNYEYIVDAYNKFWYFDRVDCSITYDASWVFKFLEEFGEDLEKERKKYVNKIIRTDIEKIIRKETNLYNNKIISIARVAMPYAVRSREYKELMKEEVVEIRVGEYLGMSEVVYEYRSIL